MIKPGDRYRHYKGEIVEVVAIAIAPINALKNQEVWINVIATDDIKEGDKVVVYSESNKVQWARPLRIFEEVLGETTKFYRFEKITC